MTRESKKSLRTPKRTSKHKRDICPICRKDLYFNEVLTQRIGIMDRNGHVNEWKCPFCESEFDLDNNILYIYGSESDSGIA